MDEIVDTISQENGKPAAEALAHDVVPSLVTLAYLEQIVPRALRSRPGGWWAPSSARRRGSTGVRSASSGASHRGADLLSTPSWAGKRRAVGQIAANLGRSIKGKL
jgi:hypothetical protein